MTVTLQELAAALDDALASSPSCRIKLASRHAGSSREVELQTLGNFILLGNDERIALVREGLCGEPLEDVPLLEPTGLLAKLEAHVDSHGECALEILNDAVVTADGERALDYGGNGVEQMIWHEQRKEIWLLIAFATVFDTSASSLAPL